MKKISWIAAAFFILNIGLWDIHAQAMGPNDNSGASVKGNIVVDGDLSDWQEVPAISFGSSGTEFWRAVFSSDKTTLYVSVQGVASSEWDQNYIWKALTFSSGYNQKWVQFGNLLNWIPGSTLEMRNEANGNTAGDFFLECSVPVSELPQDNMLISFENTDIWAATVPVLTDQNAGDPEEQNPGPDGPEISNPEGPGPEGPRPQEPEEPYNPVYNGIVIDGSFADWDAVSKVPGGCPNEGHPFCLENTAMVFDGEYIYVYLESGDNNSISWSGPNSNAMFAITTDLGNTLVFQWKDDSVRGVQGATSAHYGKKIEIAIPKSALPYYLQSISFGFYLCEPVVKDVYNLKSEEPKGEFDGIVYDGLYGDWMYFPHQTIEYATAGTSETLEDASGALYADGETLFGHVKTQMNRHQHEQASVFLQGVIFRFGESESAQIELRPVSVDGSGNIDWNPKVRDLRNGTYEFWLTYTGAWGVSSNLASLNEHDPMIGKMMVTVSDTKLECEFYLDLEVVAGILGCNPEEFKVLKAKFQRLGNQWLVTAGASSGAYLGVLLSVCSAGIVLGVRKKREGTVR